MHDFSSLEKELLLTALQGSFENPGAGPSCAPRNGEAAGASDCNIYNADDEDCDMDRILTAAEAKRIGFCVICGD